VNNASVLRVKVSDYAFAGGLYVSASGWQDPPQGPPNNPKECGGGGNSPRNNRKKDAKTAMPIGAQTREQYYVHENRSYPP
jgi:hypothetical protein